MMEEHPARPPERPFGAWGDPDMIEALDNILERMEKARERQKEKART
jgi:hypothetical protein